MKFRVLGPTELYDNVNDRRAALNSSKQRTLMGALIVKYGSSVSAERLGEEVWGECSPNRSANALQAQVYRLRRLIDRVERDCGGTQQRLITRESGYALRAEPHQIDSELFTRTVDRARRTADRAPDVAEKTLRGALRLWRGPALQGSRGPICSAGAAMLEESRFSALELLYDVSLRARMHDNIIAELEELTISHPLRERFYDQLMVALYRSGRQAQALGVYERARRHLADELGIAPVPALNKRMQQILSHAPELLDPFTEVTADTKRAQGITVRGRRTDAPPPGATTAAVPVPSGVRRPGAGTAQRPVPVPGVAPADGAEAAPLDDEVRHLRSVVARLTAQQQALMTTVRHLSSRLDDTIHAVDRRRAARPAPEYGQRRLLEPPFRADLPSGP
ncbi:MULTISPECIES: AfsR/SARP family transcriptional regulator [Streptomyces]|uniref:AfsR/SARP family transcriptional regulator n=1 Tax=Streptomyces TaxID=1883 RepID=UPI0033A480C9